MLKFDLPYKDSKNYSYIKGELRLQVSSLRFLGRLTEFDSFFWA
jgi:hypothetical protein